MIRLGGKYENLELRYICGICNHQMYLRIGFASFINDGKAYVEFNPINCGCGQIVTFDGRLETIKPK